MKKLVSIFIVLSMLLSSVCGLAKVNLEPEKVIDDIFRFDVGEFTDSNKITTSDSDVDTERIKLLHTLGVWDTLDKGKNDLISMTEFAVIMSKVRLGSENAFTDIYSKNQNSDKVTYKIAYEYLLDALGYYHECAKFNYSPEGLLIVADRIGLESENMTDINAYITRGEFSKLVLKALSIDMCIMEYTDYGYGYNVKDGETLLSKMHGIYALEGFVNAIPDLAVFGGASLRDGYIEIDRTKVFIGDKDLREYFGNRVLAYAKYDEVTGIRNLIAISYAEDNMVYEIDFADIDRINSYEVTYIDAEGNDAEIDVANLKYVTDNGSPVSTITTLTNYQTTDGKIVFSSSDGETLDTAMIYRYGYYTVEYNDLNQGRIGFKYGQKYTDGNSYLAMDEKATTVCYLDGVLVDYKTIPANATIRVFRAEDTNYTEITASTEKVTGSVTMIDGNNVVIGDKEYKIPKMILRHIQDSQSDATLSNSEKLKPVDLDLAGTFYVVGKAIVSYVTTTDYIVAFLKDVNLSRSSLDRDVSIRVFTQNADWMSMTLAEKLEIDGEVGKTKDDFIDLVNANPQVVREFIRLKTNSSGEITGIDTIIETSAEMETIDDVKFTCTSTFTMNWTQWSIASLPYFLDPATLIFVIPYNQNKEADYKIVKNTSLASDQSWTLDFYNIDEFMQVSLARLNGSVAATAETTQHFHIESIRDAIIDADENEYGYKVVTKEFVNQRAKGKGTVKETAFIVAKDAFDANPFAVGDFITANFEGSKATSWTILRQGAVIGDTDELISTGVQNRRYVVGTIKKIDVARMYVLVEANVNGTVSKVLVCPRAKGIINTTTHKARVAEMSDFHVDDRVYFAVNYGHGDYIYKTEQ